MASHTSQLAMFGNDGWHFISLKAVRHLGGNRDEEACEGWEDFVLDIDVSGIA